MSALYILDWSYAQIAAMQGLLQGKDYCIGQSGMFLTSAALHANYIVDLLSYLMCFGSCLHDGSFSHPVVPWHERRLHA